ncbi:hypothetical protein ADUPG1_011681 [Aduncisulcus paluster]|uniref:Integrase n=1 Tax=Aduncisulcus paluster TaxID=2918883 RepID=A0ABQ5JWN9_9EUKA|nr:hypothetical protein ADUPG1_011681 [Aduncisulcus paluster]
MDRGLNGTDGGPTNAQKSHAEPAGLNKSDLAREIFGTEVDSRGYTVARNRDRIGAWEAEKASPQADNLVLLADYFGIEPADLAPDLIGRTAARAPEAMSMRVLEATPDQAHLQINAVLPASVAAQVMAIVAASPGVGAASAGKPVPKGNPMETRLGISSKTGYYEIRWSERDAAGIVRTRTYSCRTKDRALAEQVRQTWLTAAGHVDNMALSHTIEELIEQYSRNHVDMNGVGATQVWVLQHIKNYFGPDLIADVTPHRVAGYRQMRSRKVKDGTIRRELGALRAVLSWAAKKGLIPVGTVLPSVDLPPASQPRETYLEEADERRMFETAKRLALDPDEMFPRRRIGYFICIALETAARAGAIQGLTWDRVDLARGLIDYREPGRKISKKRRVPVPISDRLRPVIEDLYARRDPTSPFVLGHQGSTRNPFEYFRTKHNFGGVTRHDLRRTWATLRAQRGVSMFDIAGVLGDSIETDGMTDLMKPPKVPCGSCPYRKDVPAGIWAREEYEKLPRYDAETWAQPPGVFMCHQQDGCICGGWLMAHDRDQLLALRIASPNLHRSVWSYDPPVEVFASGAEAAEHGIAGIEDVSAEAHNPTIRRQDAVDIATILNNALMGSEHFKSVDQAVALISIAMAEVVARDGRITPSVFLGLIGIQRDGRSKKPLLKPFHGWEQLEGLRREAQAEAEKEKKLGARKKASA